MVPNSPKLSHSGRLDEKALKLQLSSQRERFDLGHCKPATDGNENWTLWNSWLQCWGIMGKLWNMWLGWNLEELPSTIAQAPVPAISITTHPNSTSLLALIQHKVIFSSE